MGTPNKKEELEEATNSLPASSSEHDKLDAVRDLLFGQNIKEYRDEISELRDYVKQNRAEIDQNLEKSSQEILKKLDDLSKQFDDKTSQIEAKLDKLTQDKVDKSSLAGLLKDIAAKLEA